MKIYGAFRKSAVSGVSESRLGLAKSSLATDHARRSPCAVVPPGNFSKPKTPNPMPIESGGIHPPHVRHLLGSDCAVR